MVVVLQDDPAARAGGAHHRADHGRRVLHVLQDEPCVNHVEGAPLVGGQGKCGGISMAELHQRVLTGLVGLAARLDELVHAPFHADDHRVRAGGTSHGTAELAQAAAHVEDALVAADFQHPERLLIQ